MICPFVTISVVISDNLPQYPRGNGRSPPGRFEIALHRVGED